MCTGEKIKEELLKLSADQRKLLFPGLSDAQFYRLMQLDDKQILDILNEKLRTPQQKHWYDTPLHGLSADGCRLLDDLIEQQNRGSNHVEGKQVRYLKQLKKMKLMVPDFFRQQQKPKEFYRSLTAFCREKDIPAEIISQVVPSLIRYIETGRMTPILFVGEKGCGKTTAIRLLMEKALGLNTEVIKAPQVDGSHGLCGDCGTYQSADVGAAAKARLKYNSLLVAYLIDEIDKVTHDRNRASIDDELLSFTDNSSDSIYDNYLETTLVGLEHCPIFMTANDLQKVNPILADRCFVITFPNADEARIKSIARKFADKELSDTIYDMICFDYNLMDKHIDSLIGHNITSLRKHEQLISAVLSNALNVAFEQDSDEVVPVTEAMFAEAEKAILGSVKRTAGFAR